MKDDARIEALLGQLLDGEQTPEDVCRAVPELLPAVRERWQQVRAVRHAVDSLFPTPDPVAPDLTRVRLPPPPVGMPRVPGYAVESVLGRGGMGVVYKARHLRLGRMVALKMLLAGEYADPAQLARFVREAQVVAGLRHAHIVQLHDIGDIDGKPFFTMEFMEGGSLAHKLAGKPQPARDAAALMITLAEAMHTAHAGGVIHRDLKPGNVLLTADGTPKISDFGVARRLLDDGGITLSGATIGTPSYMAPEQAQGKTRMIGPAVDIYSLGAILYELLTGRPPFRGETAAETERQALTIEAVRPTHLNPKVPRDLETICLKCLEKPPQRRYASARELAEDLGRYQRGEPILARQASRAERIVRWVRRKPMPAALILMGLALTAVGVALGVGQWQREAHRRGIAAQLQPSLDLALELEARGQFDQAATILQHLPATDDGELRARIDAVQADLDLAQRLNQVRLDRFAVIDGRFEIVANLARVDRDYEQAFDKAGLGRLMDPTSAVADRVRASPLRSTLVGALDDWSACKREEARRGWICEVARLADPDPTGWRDRVRQPVLSREALAGLAQEAVVRDQSAQLLMALGLRLRASGADPIPFLELVQKEYPGDFLASYTLAEAIWTKDVGDCIRFYQAALAAWPSSAAAQAAMGRALAKAGRPVEAVPHFREAVRLEPTYSEAMSDLALALVQGGPAPAPEALELARRAVALDGDAAKNQAILGCVLKAFGHGDEAVDALIRATTKDPDFYFAQVSLGDLLENLGRLDEAMAAYQKASELEPDQSWAHVGIGRVFMDQGGYDDAIAELQEATRSEPTLWHAQLHTLLGDCWRAKRSPQQALVEYDQSIRIRPEDVYTGQQRREVMVQLGYAEATRAEWEQLLQWAPAVPAIWNGYAELCLYVGNQGAYERACRFMLDHFESNTDPQVWERTSRACLLGKLDDRDTTRAVAPIERAVQADPPAAPAWLHPYFLVSEALGKYRIGDFDGAVASLQGEPSTILGPLPHLILALAHGGAGRRSESLRSLGNAMRVHDWNPAHMTNIDDWLDEVLRREAVQMVLPNVAALLSGNEQPRDRDERLAVIAVCIADQRTARAADLYAEALVPEAAAAIRLDEANRCDAARCAAQAGCGIGQDAAWLTAAQRASWRERARGWLQAELVAGKSLLAGPASADRAALQARLESLLEDPMLACVRDEPELVKLPSAEQQAWTELWREAASVLAEARSGTSAARP